MCNNCTKLSESQKEAILSCPHTAVMIVNNKPQCVDCGVYLTVNFVPIISGKEWGESRATH